MIKNVLQWLEKTAADLPDKVAFEDTENTITFGEILDRSKRIGSALTKLTETKKPVIIISGRNVFTPVLFLSVVYAGCFYAPLDVTAPVYRLNKIIENTKPSLIIADSGNLEFAKSLEYDCPLYLADDLLKEEIDEEALKKVRDNSSEKDPL